jgi:hypothetical protein
MEAILLGKQVKMPEKVKPIEYYWLNKNEEEKKIGDYCFGFPDGSVYIIETEQYKTPTGKYRFELKVQELVNYRYDPITMLIYDRFVKEAYGYIRSRKVVDGLNEEKKFLRSIKGIDFVPSDLFYLAVAEKSYTIKNKIRKRRKYEKDKLKNFFQQ